MGRVWLGWDRALSRNVALKQPLGGSDSAAAAYLRREALLAARLEHPGIVVVHDLFEDPNDASPTYVMAFVRGQTIAEHLARAAGNAEQRTRLLAPFAEACAAVGHAHARGIVHRDLSPRNLLLGDDGGIRVVDWGLAADTHTSSPEILPAAGTPGFASPEQHRSAPPHPSADVWSLGEVLRHILVGQDHDGSSPPRRVSPELWAVVERATATEPAARYPDAGALAAELKRWLDGRRVEAYAFPAWKLALRFIRERRALLAVGGAGMLAVAASLVWGVQASHTEAALASEAREQARLEAERAKAAQASALADRAVEAWARLNMTTATAHALASLAIHDNPTARGVLGLLEGSGDAEVVARRQLPGCPEWHCTGRELWVCFEATSVWMWNGSREVWRHSIAHGSLRVTETSVLVVDGGDQLTELHLETGAIVHRDAQRGRFGDPVRHVRFGLGTTTPLNAGWPEAPCSSAVGAALRLRDGGHAFACAEGGVWRVDPDGTTHAPDQYKIEGFRSLAEDLRGTLWGSTTGGRIVPLDGTAFGWDMGTPIPALHVLPEKGWLLAHLDSGALRLLDPVERREVLGLPPSDHTVHVSADDTIETVRGQVWTRWRLPPHLRRGVYRSPNGFSSVDWAAGTNTLFATDGGGNLHAFEAVEGPAPQTWTWLTGVAKSVHTDPTLGIAYATGMYANGVWSVEVQPPRKLRKVYEAGENALRTAALADGRTLLLDYGAGVMAFSEANPSGTRLLTAHRFIDMAASPQRRAVLLVGKETWVIPAGEAPPRVVPTGKEYRAGAIDDDGTIAVADKTEMVLFDSTGAKLARWDLPSPAVDIAMVPSQGLVAVGSMDGHVLLWDKVHMRPVADAPAHSARVASLSGSSDGRWLASASWDGTVRILSVAAALDSPAAIARTASSRLDPATASPLQWATGIAREFGPNH